MNFFNILAETASEAPSMTEAVEHDIEIIPVDFIWEQIDTLSWFHAVLAISFGVVYLLYGWRIFKALTVISFGLIGMFGGMMLGSEMGGGEMKSEMWGGVVGLATLAIVSVPMMKYCISLLGAAAGAILFGAVWYACGFPQMFMWAFALGGAIFGGMISFIVFKMSVMLFTSLGGSAIMMSGVLSLLHKYQYLELTAEQLAAEENTFVYGMIHNTESHWFLPVVLLAPTLLGLILQNKFIKKSSEWEI